MRQISKRKNNFANEELEVRRQKPGEMQKITSFLTLFFLLLVMCCKEQDELPVTITGPEYFPLTTGNFVTYSVDSVYILQNVEIPYRFQVRVSVGPSFTNDIGNATFILQRHKRVDETKPWKPAGTWTAWTNTRQLVVTEGSVSYIKLKFPLEKGIGWNGNELNTLGGNDLCNSKPCDRYEVSAIGPEVIVKQDSISDPLQRDYRIEKYSKDIGLVYKESEVFRYCDTGSCFGTGFILTGLKYKMEMIDHGAL